MQIGVSLLVIGLYCPVASYNNTAFINSLIYHVDNSVEVLWLIRKTQWQAFLHEGQLQRI